MIVGVVMLAYVLFGGMIATTWVQIVKAVLLLGGASLLACWRWRASASIRWRCSRPRPISTAPPCWRRAGWCPIRSTRMSLGLALMLGTAGLPHILMRFYTVPDARTARTSVGYATAFIGFFYLLTFILGFGAMVIVGQPAIRAIDAGGNMAAPLLAEAVGGDGVSRVHLRRRVRDDPGGRRRPDAGRRGGAVARPLGERRARRRGVGARAAARRARRDGAAGRGRDRRSASRSRGRTSPTWWGWRSRLPRARTFPALVLSVFWRGFTTRGAQASMLVGTASSLLLIYLSPTIQIDILRQQSRLRFRCAIRASSRSRCPSLWRIVVSLLRPEADAAAGFDAMAHRLHVGE